mmetsp:Transcript_3758/g.8421  ORF Transcript_3758/g.8421 Transcript_3758/m.8421 type:complete len:216 (-) Transcript_3758:2553-3200(-)
MAICLLMTVRESRSSPSILSMASSYCASPSTMSPSDTLRFPSIMKQFPLTTSAFDDLVSVTLVRTSRALSPSPRLMSRRLLLYRVRKKVVVRLRIFVFKSSSYSFNAFCASPLAESPFARFNFMSAISCVDASAASLNFSACLNDCIARSILPSSNKSLPAELCTVTVLTGWSFTLFILAISSSYSFRARPVSPTVWLAAATANDDSMTDLSVLP